MRLREYGAQKGGVGVEDVAMYASCERRWENFLAVNLDGDSFVAE